MSVEKWGYIVDCPEDVNIPKGSYRITHESDEHYYLECGAETATIPKAYVKLTPPPSKMKSSLHEVKFE